MRSGVDPNRRGPVATALPQQPAQPTKKLEIDREKTCPLLIRVFPKLDGHHRWPEFAKPGNEPEGEIQIYTWQDATLRELAELIKDVNRAARNRNAELRFGIVYPDKRGRTVLRERGIVHSSNAGPDDNKTLHDLNFQTGDFLDVAIFAPH